MQKILILKNIFSKHWIQCLLLFIVFIILAIIFLNIPLSKIDTSLPNHIDAYLVTWVWSWENYVLPNNPTHLFNANIFAPFEDTLAYTETMLGSFLLAWPILIIFNNIFLAYNIVILLTFAIAGLGMYLLVYSLTKDKLAAFLSALIYAFAPFKLIHSIGHLHLTGMWLPYVFLYLHKFFKKQSWHNSLLLTLFIILVFLTGFHYFIFLPVVIAVFLLVNYLSKNFKFNKNNFKKIILSLILSALIIIPIILPYIHLKEKYNFIRSVETVEAYSPDLIDYFIPPFLYNHFYINRSHVEMAVGPGIVISLLFLLAIYFFSKQKKINQEDKRNFIIYSIIIFISFIISFGFYIQLNSSAQYGLPSLYSLFYAFIPGFDGIRATGRYSVFVLLGLTVLIGYGLYYYFSQQKNIFKKIIIYFLIIFFLFIELSFVPSVSFSEIKISPQLNKFYNWMKLQPDNKIFLNFPIGFGPSTFNNFDAIYVFNSRLHFKKIVNGYSGKNSPNYQNLVVKLNFLGPLKNLSLLKKYKVDYLIYHFDFYKNPEKIKQWYLSQLALSDKIKYITHFGNNYIYKIMY